MFFDINNYYLIEYEQPGREETDPRPAEAEQLARLEHQRVARGRQPLPLDRLHRRPGGYRMGRRTL